MKFPLLVSLFALTSSVALASSGTRDKKAATPDSRQEQAVPASALVDQPKEVEIRDWFAFGSGCRSRKDQPGDETMEFLGKNPKNPNEYLVRISMPKYALDGDKPVRTNPTFARQCSIRIAAFLPKDKRIREVHGSTSVVFSKDENVRLEIASQMMLGQDVVASKIEDFPSGKGATGQSVDLLLKKKVGDSGFPEQACGAPKILGFDISLTNWRETSSPKVHASLNAAQTLTIGFEVENCVVTNPTKK